MSRGGEGMRREEKRSKGRGGKREEMEMARGERKERWRRVGGREYLTWFFLMRLRANPAL